MNTENSSDNNQSCPTSEKTPSSCPCSSSRWFWLAIPLLAVVIMVMFQGRGESQSTSSGSDTINWNSDYDSAMAQAAQQNKPILVAFSATWCGPCQTMKKTVYHDPEVVKVSQSFVPIFIDTDENGELAREYGVRGIPSYFLLQPDGTVIESFSGSRDASEFAAKLKNAL
jgi:thiol:disulfide interchange protein